MIVEAGAEVLLTSSGAVGELMARYSDWQKFDCLIENNGTLTVENVVLNGNNLFVTTAATIINNAELTLGEGAELNVNGTTRVALINNGKRVEKAEAKINATRGYFWDVKPEDFVGGKITVAAINGDKLYTTLQAAIDNAEDGDLIVLSKNFKNATAVVIEGVEDLKIDFNGFWFAATEDVDGAALVVKSDASVLLKDTRGGSYLKVDYSAWDKFDCVVENEGALVVENLTINGNNLFNADAAAFINNGDLTLEPAANVMVKKAAMVIGNPAN